MHLELLVTIETVIRPYFFYWQFGNKIPLIAPTTKKVIQMTQILIFSFISLLIS